MTDLLQLHERRPSPPSTGSAHADLIELRQTLVPMLDGLSRSFGYERALVALYDPVREMLRGSVGVNVPEDRLLAAPVERAGAAVPRPALVRTVHGRSR